VCREAGKAVKTQSPRDQTTERERERHGFTEKVKTEGRTRQRRSKSVVLSNGEGSEAKVSFQNTDIFSICFSRATEAPFPPSPGPRRKRKPGSKNTTRAGSQRPHLSRCQLPST